MAGRWLAAIDRGDATETWEQAASLFREAVPPEDRTTSLGRVRALVGRPLSRTLDSAEEKRELPGAPDGEYVLLRYKTRFEHRKEGVETVVSAGSRRRWEARRGLPWCGSPGA